MSSEIPLKKLGEVCDFQNGFAFKSKTFKESGVPVIRISDIQDQRIDTSKIVYVKPEDYKKNLARYEIIKGDLLIAMSGATTGKIGFVEEDQKFLLNQRVGKFEPKENLDKNYLFYYLSTKVEESLAISAGSAQPNLSTKQIKGFEIPIPPLPEQKRIVAILDEAFEAIDKAKENVERNIENAEELFQSKLNEIFSQREEGWITEKLSNVFKMKSGDQLSKKNVVPGPYPVYGGNGVTAHHHEYNLEGQQILIGRVGAQCGNIHLTNEKIWLTDNAFQVKDLKFDFDFEFLEHLLRVKDLRQTARQSAQPVISNSSCKDLRLVFPEDTTKQKDIAKLINTLDAEVLQIIKAYKTRLKSLEELKKSILQRAFSGELTANETVAV